MKVSTIEQFLVLDFIMHNFKYDEVEIKIIDDLTLNVIDKNNGSANFKYDVKDKQVKVLYLK